MSRTKQKGKWSIFLIVPLVFLLTWSASTFAADDAAVTAAVQGGQRYLMAQQTPAVYDGGTYVSGGEWIDAEQSYYPVASTALVVAALIETGIATTDQHIIDGINYLRAQVQTADGGIYTSSDQNYNTAAALVALALFEDPADEDIIQNAVNYILTGQYIADAANANYGGFTYTPPNDWGSADLSNTQFAVMGLWYAYRYLGLSTAGTEWADPLLIYLQRSHGWNDTEAGQTWNDQAWASGKNILGTDGAFSYQPSYESFYPGGPMTAAGIWSLAMIGQDQNPMVGIAQAWFDSNYTWARTPGSYYDWDTFSAHYYFIYSMAKALTATLGDTPLGAHDWVQDLKNQLIDGGQMNIVEGAEPQQNYWLGTGIRDGAEVLNTAFALMSLAFADPATESTKKLLADNDDPNVPDENKGLVTLSVPSGITISDASRKFVSDGETTGTVELPIGAVEFTINHVPDGDEVVLTIQVPAGALDPDNPDSFVNADGSIKEGLQWFKIEDGKWKGQSDIPIEIDKDAGAILVTLKDGGFGDEDGEENGEIQDPGAPGYGEEEGGGGTSGGGDGGGGGCFVSTAVTGAGGNALGFMLVALFAACILVRGVVRKRY